jgi:hypothetical protein
MKTVGDFSQTELIYLNGSNRRQENKIAVRSISVSDKLNSDTNGNQRKTGNKTVST